MKRLLLFLMMVVTQGAHATEPALSNGGMPKGMPSTILVQRIPFGSGTPSPGVTSGYDVAVAVGDGLYSVPGYLPNNADGFRMDPRVIPVKCAVKIGIGDILQVWTCGGYSITPAIGRGEYILIRPVVVQ